MELFFAPGVVAESNAHEFNTEEWNGSSLRRMYTSGNQARAFRTKFGDVVARM